MKEEGLVDIAAQTEGYFGFTCLTELVFRMVDLALIVAGILLLVLLIWGGLDWAMSGGDKGKIETARGRIVNAVTGIAVVAAAFAAWQAALYFFGIDVSQICTPAPFGT